MKTLANQILIIIPAIGILLSFFLAGCEPQVSDRLKEKFVYTEGSDSLLQENRAFGNITLHKFNELLSRSGIYDTTSLIQRSGDSILFSIANNQQMNMFLGYGDGSNEGEIWTRKYKNLPISIHADNTIAAKVNHANGKEYIYIPYEMLFCVVDYVGQKGSSPQNRGCSPTPSKRQDSLTTFKSQEEIVRKSAGGKKIEVEGLVLKNTTDILSQHYSGRPDQVEQLKTIHSYVRKNWIYIYDPAINRDVWRSASETIENYYFSSNRKYTGDCDDFAILMASFARQLGLQSRFVAEWTEGISGHAHAEYSIDGISWYSLDWDGSAFKNINSRHSPYKHSEKYYDL